MCMHLKISLCLHDLFIGAIGHDQAQTESADWFIFCLFLINAVILGDVTVWNTYWLMHN